MSSAEAPSGPAAPAPSPRAGFGPTFVLCLTLAVAGFLLLMGVTIRLSHPHTAGLGAFVGRVNQQNQGAKSLLYAAAFFVILPATVIAVPRLADRIAVANPSVLPVLSAGLAGGLALVLLAVRISRHLPWGDGLRSLIVAMIVWGVVVAAVLARAAKPRPWPALSRWESAVAPISVVAGVLVFALLLSLGGGAWMRPVPLVAGAIVCAAGLFAVRRFHAPQRGPVWHVAEVVVLVIAALAIVNVVVFRESGQLPSIYLPPGVIQNQQDYLLGSVNQLLGGGALLVNVPVSQYGVGMVYFLAGWFHLAPIGYGTLGFLDSLLTVVFYLAGYAVLRTAGVRRTVALSALAVAVVALALGLHYPIGALPETGPLRFGLPIVVVLARTAAERWPSRRRWADAACYCAIAVAAVWAFEAFAYTILTYLCVLAVQAWLRPAGTRRRWLVRQLGWAVAVVLAAHVILAAATLVFAGQLPHWGQYFDYLRSFLLGGQAGSISYGFEPWSPGLAVDAAALASAAAVVLLAWRLPAVIRARPALLVGLAGVTAYAIALASYTDNRSSTYLLLYVGLPTVLLGALWLEFVLATAAVPALVRRGAVVFALAVVVVLIASAWSNIGTNFNETALAHAYPGGGLSAAMRRLWHPPPIDPRAPEGVRLLDRYIPGRRALILLPTVPDLSVEILMRAGRTSPLFISDPVDDSLVLANRMRRLEAEVSRLHVGQRILIDRDALAVLAGLRAQPGIDPAKHPIMGGDQQTEWLLTQIDRRFRLQPIYRDPNGLIVAALAPRSG